jgi:hypothetical protein
MPFRPCVEKERFLVAHEEVVELHVKVRNVDGQPEQIWCNFVNRGSTHTQTVVVSREFFVEQFFGFVLVSHRILCKTGCNRILARFLVANHPQKALNVLKFPFSEVTPSRPTKRDSIVSAPPAFRPVIK